MKYLSPLTLLVLAGVVIFFSETLRSLFLANLIGQLFLFLVVAHIPTLLTGRMSYVDLAWPFGLLLIGIIVMVFASGEPWRVWLVGFIYVSMGMRMGILSVRGLIHGAFTREFNRYQYQRLRWEKEGKTHVPLAMHIDVAAQALLNISLLCLPAFLFSNSLPSDNSWMVAMELFGGIVWCLCFMLEWLSDAQKRKFSQSAKSEGKSKAVCTIGLWQYSRHPNYFFEWMLWNALVLMTTPALLSLISVELDIVVLLIAIVLFYLPFYMFNGLLYGTGVEPSEYYSEKSRPEYSDYQSKTNKFFPNFFC